MGTPHHMQHKSRETSEHDVGILCGNRRAADEPTAHEDDNYAGKRVKSRLYI